MKNKEFQNITVSEKVERKTMYKAKKNWVIKSLLFSTVLLFIFSGCTSSSTSSTNDSKKISTETSQEESSSSYYEGQVVDDIKKTSDYLSFNKIIDTNGKEYSPPNGFEKFIGHYQFVKDTDYDRKACYFLTIHDDGSFTSNLVTELKGDSESTSDRKIYFDKTDQLQQTAYISSESTLKSGVITQAYGNYYLQPLEQLELPLMYDQDGNLTINYLTNQLYHDRSSHNGEEHEIETVRKDDDIIAIADGLTTVNISDIYRWLDTSDGGGPGGEGSNATLSKIDKQNELAKRSVFQFEKYVQKNKTKFQQIRNLNDLLKVSNSTDFHRISAIKPETLNGYTADNKQPKLKYAFSEDAGNGIIFYTATDGKYLYKGVNDADPIEWDSTPLFE